MRWHGLTLKSLGVVVLFGSVALAQTSTGSISGRVQDESGAVVPGVSVTVTNVDTGIGSSLPTDASGRYHVPSLIPGRYEIQAQLTGFETGVRRGVQVTVGSNLEINMVLKVGQVTQKTVVTAEAPMVETASSAVSGLVDDQTIRELPLNGRSFDQLIALQSSAPMFRTQNRSSLAADVYSVSGARFLSNLLLIDGTEMLGGSSIATSPGGTLGKNMGVDAIQEFAVLSSNYTAAYGKKGGGIINIATRSGTNQIHGSAFEFLRNSDLDARNFFDSRIAPFKRNNFGGSLGGPVRKDRSFFFGNYEGLRESLGLTNLAIVPDADSRSRAVPAVKPYIDLFYPLPNGRTFGDGTGEYRGNPNQPSRLDFFLVRFDQRISDKDSFFARYNFSQSDQNVPAQVGPFVAASGSRDQIATLEWKRAYARTVHALRFGFTRSYIAGASLTSVPVDRSLSYYPWVPLPGQFNFAGGLNPSGGGTLTRGGPGSPGSTFAVNQFDVADQVFHYRGAHSLQFGAQLQRLQHNDDRLVLATFGTFVFNDLQGLLAGRPTSFTGIAEGGDPHKSYRQIYFSTFFQDDYKVRPNLTLNLGLRYELFSVPVEVSGNRISNYHYQFRDGIRVLDPLPTLGSPFFPSNHNAFAPRIGFAWNPSHDGKLAVRGGFGMFFDQVDSDWRNYTPNNPPFSVNLQVNNPPFPHGLSGGGATAPLPAPDVIDFNYFKVPTRLQYSFGIQRQITTGSVFSIGYVGSHSYHLVRLLEGNTGAPQILAGGVFFYPAGLRPIQPALGSVRFLTTDTNGDYNSLQLDFTQRPSRGLRYKVSYTFAKNIDEASRTFTGFSNGEASGAQNPFDRKGEHSLSAYDFRNNLVVNFNYDVPGRNLSGFPGRVLGGWQLGGIVTLTAGTPFTALTGFSRSRDLNTARPDRPNLKAGASNNPVLGGPDRYFDSSVFELPAAGFYGNLGRNTLIEPGVAQVDFTLAKMTSVTERLKVDFRSEFFNLFNRANFDIPAHAIFNSAGQYLGSAGRIQKTTTTSRQIQFGAKLIF